MHRPNLLNRRSETFFMETNNTPQLSIVIPAYNEAESLPVLLQQIQAVLETHAYTAEVIFVNDGSTDGTSEVVGSKHIGQKSSKNSTSMVTCIGAVGLLGELIVAFLARGDNQ